MSVIDQYVIMPNHIHIVLLIGIEAAGASPRPTVMDIICAYKSLTTRECKKNGWKNKLFQTSFHDHNVRNRDDYDEIVKYIYENPMRWKFDGSYAEE
ncbi:MAG: transposase [Clostridia bacterium]|nr:transposase [Clostridia bacterium]